MTRDAPQQEPDLVPRAPLLASWLAIAAGIAASVLAAVAIAALGGGVRGGTGNRPGAAVPDEVNRVESHLYARPDRGYLAPNDLDRWRWIDPSRRLVAMPIDRAIDRYLAEHAR